jgi:hypothetical protein
MVKIKVMVMLLILAIVGVVYAYDDGDFQVWNTDTEEFKISPQAKIALEEEFRWGDNANEFYYHHYDLGLVCGLKKYLNLGGGYRHVYELKRGKFKLENEPYLTLTLLGDLKGFKFDDRSRLEYRHFDYQSDSWRYRNKFTLKFPWEFTGAGIQPYLADEIFIVFNDAQFSQNRFYSGVGFILTKSIRAEIYYLLQSSKSSGRWTDANVLGTKLKIAF